MYIFVFFISILNVKSKFTYFHVLWIFNIIYMFLFLCYNDKSNIFVVLQRCKWEIEWNINFIKILSQSGSFKTHFMKTQLRFIILRKISENSVHFSQFQDTFSQKHHKYHNIFHCHVNIKIL